MNCLIHLLNFSGNQWNSESENKYELKLIDYKVKRETWLEQRLHQITVGRESPWSESSQWNSGCSKCSRGHAIVASNVTVLILTNRFGSVVKSWLNLHFASYTSNFILPLNPNISQFKSPIVLSFFISVNLSPESRPKWKSRSRPTQGIKRAGFVFVESS